MKIRHVSSAVASRGDAVFVLAPDGRIDAGKPLADASKNAQATGDLSSDFRSVVVFHQPGRSGLKRLGVVGVGKPSEVTTERIRRVAALAQARAAAHEVAGFSVVVPANVIKKQKPLAAGMAIAEGLVLGSYAYKAPRKEAAKKPHAAQVQVAAVGLSKVDEAEFARGLGLGAKSAEGTVFARDLGNQPANILTPTAMAKAAKKLGGGRLTVKVLDEKQMEKLGVTPEMLQPSFDEAAQEHAAGAKEQSTMDRNKPAWFIHIGLAFGQENEACRSTPYHADSQDVPETHLISACRRNPTVASSPASQKFQDERRRGS